jgi:hypothetical protein
MFSRIGSGVQRIFASRKPSKDSRRSSAAGDLTKPSDVRANDRNTTDPFPLGSSGKTVVQSARGEVMGKQESERNSPLKKSTTSSTKSTTGEVLAREDPNELSPESTTRSSASGRRLSQSLAIQREARASPDPRRNRNAASDSLDSSVQLDPIRARLARPGAESATRTKKIWEGVSLWPKVRRTSVASSTATLPVSRRRATCDGEALVRLSSDCRQDILEGIGELVDSGLTGGSPSVVTLEGSGELPGSRSKERVPIMEELSASTRCPTSPSEFPSAEEPAEACNAERGTGRWSGEARISQASATRRGSRASSFSYERTHETSSNEAIWQQIAPSGTSYTSGSPQSALTNSPGLEELTAAPEKADNAGVPRHKISKSFKRRRSVAADL